MTRPASHILRLASCLFAVAFLVVSCSKEEMEGPRCGDEVGVAKNGSILVVDPTMNGGADRDNRAKSDGDSISDDGDDVGDGERTRKKKPN